MFLFKGALWFLMLTVSGAVDQASFAANTGNLTGNHDPLAFHAAFVNSGNALDQSTWKLGIHSFGLFLVTLSAGHPGAGGYTSYMLQKDGSTMTRIYAAAATGARDNTIGVDFVSFFNQHDELHIKSSSTNLVSTSNGKLTSWGTVSLSHEMGVQVAFGVCQTSSNAAGQITYNQIWANAGNSWNPDTNTFIAPLSGIYFFSFSVGLSSTTFSIYLYLRLNGYAVFYVYSDRNTPYFTDSAGRSVMIHLRRNDRVTVTSSVGGYSDSTCLTTFSGFLYSALRDEQLAWAVYSTISQFGIADPLVYNHVEVTEGGAWVNNQAYCSYTGLYYIHISACAHDNYPVQLTVMKGSMPQGELTRVTAGPYGMMRRSMIIQCNAGETLKVVQSSSSGLYSTPTGKLTGFIGFYLFA